MPTLTPLAPSLASPDPIVARWPGHKQTVHALVALPGGDRAWSAGEDGRAILWSIPGGEALAELEGAGPVNHLALDPRGELLISAHDDGTARLWLADDGARGPVLRGHGHYVRQAAIDGERAATACEDGYVRIFDLEGRLLHTLGDGEGAWTSVLLHDGKVIAGRRDNRLVVWDALSGEERPPLYVAETKILGHGGWFLAVPIGPSAGHRQTGPQALAMAPDGVLWSGSEGVLGWDFAGRARIAERRCAWTVNALVADDEGVAAAAHVVELWDPAGVHRQLPGPERGATAITRAGRYLVVGGAKGEILVLDPRVAEPVGRHAGYVLGLALDPVRRLAATGDSDGTVRVWDLDDGRQLALLDRWPEPNSHPFAFTADGRLLTSRGDGSPALTVWDPRSGEVLREFDGPPEGDLGGVHGLGVLGDQALVGGGRSAVALWDLRGDRHRVLAGPTRQVSSVVAEPSGRYLATLGWFSPEVLRGCESEIGGTQEHLQIWSIEAGVLCESFAGVSPAGERFALRFGPLVAVDGGWIARSGRRASELARWEPERAEPTILDLGEPITELGPADDGAFAVHGEAGEGRPRTLTIVDAALTILATVPLPARPDRIVVGGGVIALVDDERLLLVDDSGAITAALELGERATELGLVGDRIVVGTSSGRVHVVAIG